MSSIFEPIFPYYPYRSDDFGNISNEKVEPLNIHPLLNRCQMEEAKNAIYDHYGDSSLETAEKLILIIDELIWLNSRPLSKQHEDLNYTLEAALQLADRICRICHNKVDMLPAIKAINKVANAFANKNNYCKAVEALQKLNPIDAQDSMRLMLGEWKNYIENTCPYSARAEQNALYMLGVKDYQVYWFGITYVLNNSEEVQIK